MFNNPFLKKDPLLEAVKSAQAEGEMRRAAEAIVNEEFGVYSRNAVIRENLAAYDAALEETFTALKEGNKENKEKKKEHEEKTGMEHIKKMGGFPGQSLKRTARELTKEELSPKDKSLAALGSPKNKITRKDVLIGRGVLPKEKKVEEGTMKEEPVDYLGKSTVTQDRDPKATSYDKTLPQTYPGAAKSDATKGVIDRSKASVTPIKEAVKKEYDDKDQSEHGVYKGKKKLGYVVKDKKSGTHTAYHGPSGGDYENVDDFPSKRKAVKQVKQSANLYKNMEESAYSAKAARAGKDIGKPGKNFEKIAKKAGEKYGSKERGEAVAGKILSKIRSKHMKEENLHELSAFGSAFAAARKAHQSNFSFGGKSYNTKMDTGPQGAPGLKGPGAGTGPATRVRDLSAPTPPSRPSTMPAPSSSASSPQGAPGLKGPGGWPSSTSSAPKAPVTPVEPGGSSNPPTTSGDVTSYAKPSVDNQRSMATTQDAGTPKPSARLQRIGESVEVGDNKYRIV